MQYPISRRGFLAAVPAAAIVAGCVPSAKVLDGNWGQFAAGTAGLVDHSAWDAFLSRYLLQSEDGVNRIRYAAAASADPMMLRSYLTALETVDPASLGKDEQMAFWINLYNAATVDLILQKPSVKSIRDLGQLTLGPWDKKIVMIAGTRLSLNNIEHGILRPIWNDVRIHYWNKFRDDAGLSDFRLHDLRHNFASHAAMNKETLPMIGRLLGHAHVQSTARYAHLDDGHALEAAEQIGAAVERMLG